MPWYAELDLQSITSIDQNELTNDEIKINVGSKEVWSGDMQQGQTVDLSSLNNITIGQGDFADVRVWEGDDWEPWPLPNIDPDDLLGTQRVYADSVKPGDQPLHLTLDFAEDGHYQIDALLIA
jgi:hypothetical protein